MSTLINVCKQQTNEFSRLNFLINWMGRIDALIEVDLRNMALCNLRWELSQLTSHWACGNQICYKCNECICTKFVNSRKRFTLIFRQESTCQIRTSDTGLLSMCMNFYKGNQTQEKFCEHCHYKTIKITISLTVILSLKPVCIGCNTSWLDSSKIQTGRNFGWAYSIWQKKMLSNESWFEIPAKWIMDLVMLKPKRKS